MFIGLPLPVVEDMMQFGRRNVELKFLVRNASDSAATSQPAPSATVEIPLRIHTFFKPCQIQER
jgi:hypothetical protein